MKLDLILKLGHPKLYERSEPVAEGEVVSLQPVVRDLREILMEFKAKYGAGRAIAAPQIGVMKRLIYFHINQPVILINPELYERSPEMIEVWDDCMCFPNLLVKVRRHKRCKLKFLNENWKQEIWELEDDLSELFQHECDHLDGILAIQRAMDPKSFAWR